MLQWYILLVDNSVCTDAKAMANQLVEDITLHVLCWWAAVPFSIFAIVKLVHFVCVKENLANLYMHVKNKL